MATATEIMMQERERLQQKRVRRAHQDFDAAAAQLARAPLPPIMLKTDRRKYEMPA